MWISIEIGHHVSHESFHERLRVQGGAGMIEIDIIYQLLSALFSNLEVEIFTLEHWILFLSEGFDLIVVCIFHCSPSCNCFSDYGGCRISSLFKKNMNHRL